MITHSSEAIEKSTVKSFKCKRHYWMCVMAAYAIDSIPPKRLHIYMFSLSNYSFSFALRDPFYSSSYPFNCFLGPEGTTIDILACVLSWPIADWYSTPLHSSPLPLYHISASHHSGEVEEHTWIRQRNHWSRTISQSRSNGWNNEQQDRPSAADHD